MKKLLSLLLSSAVLILTISGCGIISDDSLNELLYGTQEEETPPPTPAIEQVKPTEPPPTPEPSPEPGNEIYAQLYGELSSVLNEHGYGRVEQDDFSGATRFYGVLYADLIDFDNDGVYELFYILGDSTGVFTFTCEIFGSSQGRDIRQTDGVYTIHGEAAVGFGANNIAYYIASFWEMEETSTFYFTIADGVWTQVLDRTVYYEFDPDTGDFGNSWFVNGASVSESAYNDAAQSLGISQTKVFDSNADSWGSFAQVDGTLQRLEELMGGASASSPGNSGSGTASSGWDASSPMQITTADSNKFTVPVTDWQRVEDYTYGGRIEINEPVGGIISSNKNFHQFTLSDMEVSNDFGLTLVIEASTDEPFEIYLGEYHNYSNGFGEWYGEWFDSTQSSQYVTNNGRNMTIRIPAQHYGIDEWVWQINCPEYQWDGGSDLKLKFAFLLEPGERPYEP